MNDSSQKPGKHLNEIVRRIQQAIGEGAEVLSGARIHDFASEGLREIDVLVRSKMDGKPIMIVMECRDHKRPVDVGYIDHVVTKKLDVKADKAVIISTAGFTAQATRKAEFHGISLMTVEDASTRDWADWLQPQAISYFHTYWRVTRAEWMFKDASLTEFPVGKRRGFDDSSRDINTPRIFTREGRQGFSVADIMNQMLDGYAPLFEDMTPNGPPEAFSLPAFLPPGLGVSYVDGRFVEVMLVQFIGDIRLIHQEAKINRFELCDASGKPVARYAEANVTLFGNDLTPGDKKTVSLVGRGEDSWLTVENAAPPTKTPRRKKIPKSKRKLPQPARSK